MMYITLPKSTGSDGALTSTATDSYIDSSATKASASTLTATNASFTAGQYIFIIQMQGTGAGVYMEFNRIASYVAGTITTVNPLQYNYDSTGANKAQVMVYHNYTTSTGTVTITGKAWDGSVGGLFVGLFSSPITNALTINMNGKGFRGGNGQIGSTDQTGMQGESYSGVGTNAQAKNGSGGGGGSNSSAQPAKAGGGGAGNAAAGTAGGSGNAAGGEGGDTQGSADLTTAFVLGAGGGQGAYANQNPIAGNGGGNVIIGALEVGSSVIITLNGTDGNAGSSSKGGSGGGSAGMGYGQFERGTIGSWTATKGLGGSAGTERAGGDGADGRFRVDMCSLVSTAASPAPYEDKGGHPFCFIPSAIL